MFEIFVDTHFSGGHHLRDYPGNCERPHGHNWKVTATVRTTELDELGMGIDFRTLKAAVANAIDDLDHRDLNEHPAFHTKNPSSENIAIHLFRKLQKALDTDRCHVHSITIRETEGAGVTYFGS